MNPSFKSFLKFPLPLIKIVVGITACLGSMLLIKTCIAQPLLYKLFDNKMLADSIKNGISFSVLLISYRFFSKYYEHRIPVELSVKNLPQFMLGGFTLGFFAISLSIFILYLLGSYKIITLSTTHYTLQLFTLLLTAALVEDLLIRGLIIRVLENWLGTYITLIIAMLFETLHIFNPNATLFSAIFDLAWGFTMAMLFIYSRRIWLPFFFHVGWNFSQPFYGSNLTGIDNMGTIIQSEFSGPEILTGGKVGIEGSIFTLIFLIAIGLTVFYFAKKEGKIIKRRKTIIKANG